MFVRSNPGVTHCKKKLKFKLLYFQNKACHRAENRSADISLKRLLPEEGKNSKFLIVVFFRRHVKTKNIYANYPLQKRFVAGWKIYVLTFPCCHGFFQTVASVDLRTGKVLSGKVFPLLAIAVDFHSVSWEICQHSSRKLAGRDDRLV